MVIFRVRVRVRIKRVRWVLDGAKKVNKEGAIIDPTHSYHYHELIQIVEFYNILLQLSNLIRLF